VGAALVLPGLAPTPTAGRATPSANPVEDLRARVARLDSQGSSSTTLSGYSDADLERIDTQLAELDRRAAEAKSIPAWVLSAPFELQTENVARFVPNYTNFYAPAVLALLLQHLAITLAALSMARIRLLGLMELLRTSPVRPTEVVVGNYLSYGTLCAIAGAMLVGLLVFAVGVPMFGSWPVFVGVLSLLVLSSLGIGFVVSMIASSEQQAAQIAMLVLIGSVFFSGFIVSLETITWPIRALSYAFPATYAIRTLQDTMLRGVLRTPLDLVVLGGVSVVLFLATVGLFRREYKPR
jgi:ABC-2 type transport system permease protein